jgi:predicted nucleotidyltransferase
MIVSLRECQPKIAELCCEYGVRKLEVFGSASTGAFDPASSDYDFVIDFAEYVPGVATRFIEFGEALEALLGKPVDFVFDSSFKPRTRAFIENQRETVFEATDGAVAA